MKICRDIHYPYLVFWWNEPYPFKYSSYFTARGVMKRHRYGVSFGTHFFGFTKEVYETEAEKNYREFDNYYNRIIRRR